MPQKPGVFAARERLNCTVDVIDPDGDPWHIIWQLQSVVSSHPNVGGDWEPRVEGLPGVVGTPGTKACRAEIDLPAPAAKYHLFVYAHGGEAMPRPQLALAHNYTGYPAGDLARDELSLTDNKVEIS